MNQSSTPNLSVLNLLKPSPPKTPTTQHKNPTPKKPLAVGKGNRIFFLSVFLQQTDIHNRLKMMLRHLHSHSGETDTEAISIFLHTLKCSLQHLKKKDCSAAASVDIHACTGRGTQLFGKNLPSISKEHSYSGAKSSIRNLMQILKASKRIRPV